MSRRGQLAASQRGVALVVSLLLLVIITILALSLFRSFGSQEKIAGNVREKDRALHAAESAQQYAEWWLVFGNGNLGSVTCTAAVYNAIIDPVQVCNQTPQQANWAGFTLGGIPAVPWTTAWDLLPYGMSVTAGVPGANGDPPYAATPAFYIADVGIAADGQGEAYQIDAFGYGGSTAAVAVVESTFEVKQGVVCLGGCGQ
jgi:type IV pilus assembly protein PilX